MLHKFCNTFGMQVNTSKTKVMVYKKGSRLALNAIFFYGNVKLEIVNIFTYVGVTFTSSLSLNIMSSELALKAK